MTRARADTPGCEAVAHLNNAGASLPTRRVVDRVIQHLELEASVGGYEAELAVHSELEQVYSAVAGLIGADKSEIALLDSATRAWVVAFEAIEWQVGDRILTSEAEYASNFIAFLQVQERYGVEVDVVRSSGVGTLDLGDLESRLDDRVRLVAVTHVPTDSGLVNPVAEIGRLVRTRSSALYLVDACQSVGQLPISVDEIKCDFLSATGRKFVRAPRGTGFLFAARDTTAHLEPRTADLSSAEWLAPDSYVVRDDARRFAYWEGNLAAQLGLGEAARYAIEVGADAIWARIQALAEYLRERLSAAPGITLRDDDGPRCGIVTFTSDTVPAEQLCGQLRSLGYNTWPVGRSASVLNMDRRGVREVVRASVHYYNREEELDGLIDALAVVHAV